MEVLILPGVRYLFLFILTECFESAKIPEKELIAARQKDWN